FECALEELSATRLVGQRRFDPPERLGDRVVLLVEALQAPIDLVEVAEDFLEARFHPLLERVEALLERVEPATEDGEPAVHPIEAPIDTIEALVDGGELVGEELDQLPVLAARHDAAHLLRARPCIQVSKKRYVVERRTRPLVEPPSAGGDLF